jgi:pimeloyl-ACP methyl ester carboxylesterase
MIRARQMQTSRCQMAWLEAGAGWPVMFLHAFPLDANMWRPQLEHVPSGWRFIAPDLRGFGATRARNPPPHGQSRAETLGDHAADIGDFMDCLEMDDAVIVGLSMGGYLAFEMYRQAPARFNGLVLADTRPQADTPAGREARTAMRALLAREGTSAIAAQMVPKLLSPRARTEDAALVADVRRMIEEADTAGLDAAIAAMMARPDSTADLPRIACATMVVVGEMDEITPVADAQAMQVAIPRSTLAVAAGAGHLSNLERPDWFNKALGDFLLARL